MDAYTQMMYMQEDPDKLSQLATAQSLRGQESTGGQLALSTVPGGGGRAQGLAMQSGARDKAKQIGLMQAKKKQMEARDKDSARRLTAAMAKKNKGAGSDAFYKATSKQQKEFEAQANKIREVGLLAGQFQPEFAGEIVPWMGSLGNAAMAPAGGMLEFFGQDETARKAEWWGNWKKFYENIERNELFGSALTEPETRQWKLSNISPDMSEAQINRRLEIQRMMFQSRAARSIANELAKGRPMQWMLTNYEGVIPDEAFMDPLAYGKQLDSELKTIYEDDPELDDDLGGVEEWSDDQLQEMYEMQGGGQ